VPDIAMCDNTECPRRQDCYRYRAVPTERRQAYCEFVGGVECPDFWPIDGRRVVERD